MAFPSVPGTAALALCPLGCSKLSHWAHIGTAHWSSSGHVWSSAVLRRSTVSLLSLSAIVTLSSTAITLTSSASIALSVLTVLHVVPHPLVPQLFHNEGLSECLCLSPRDIERFAVMQSVGHFVYGSCRSLLFLKRHEPETPRFAGCFTHNFRRSDTPEINKHFMQFGVVDVGRQVFNV